MSYHTADRSQMVKGIVFQKRTMTTVKEHRKKLKEEGGGEGRTGKSQ
jgi:hypothetical protein